MARIIRFLTLTRMIGQGVRSFVPWIWRAFVGTVTWLAVTFVTFWEKVPERSARIADVWLDRAHHANFPTIWDEWLYNVLWALAFATIVLGWVVLSFITVGLIALIF